jgi:hypothetical protein
VRVVVIIDGVEIDGAPPISATAAIAQISMSYPRAGTHRCC